MFVTETLLTIGHIFVCVFLIILVLLQQGKGADLGATFGGGSNTVFGASGADNILSRMTKITAALFMFTSVMLAIGSDKVTVKEGTLFENLPEQSQVDLNTAASEVSTEVQEEAK